MSDELPEGWAAVRVEDILGEPMANGRSVPDGNGFPVLRLTALRAGRVDLRERKLGAWTKTEGERFQVRRGDFLVARGNGSLALVGRGGLVDQDPDPVAYPDTAIRLRPRNDIMVPEFLRAAWDSRAVRRQVEDAAHTTAGIHKVSQGDLASIEVPLPPPPEQRRIVEKVEALFEQVNRAKARLDRLPLILKRFRQAVLAAACSGRLTEEWRERRLLLEQWREASLSELLREPLRNGHSAKKSSDGKGVPTFSLSAFTDGDFSSANVKMTVADPAKVGDLWAQPGDIYVERANTPELVGTARLYDGPRDRAIVPDLVIRVRVRDTDAVPRFIEHCLRAQAGRDYFTDRAQGTAGSMPKIDQGAVSAFPVSLPPLDEQVEIVRQVDRLFALANTIEHRVQAATSRADKLPQAILSKAFSGELVPTEADLARAEGRTYETAEELLARVRRDGEDGREDGAGTESCDLRNVERATVRGRARARAR